MIRRGVRIQLVAFLLITVLGIGYAGIRYVGLGQQIFNKPFTVTVLAQNTGGIFVNAEVTWRGVQIGKVSSVELPASKGADTPDGVAIKLSISNKYDGRIPKDTSASVANLSAVGEQYIDLKPASDTGPYLHDGDTIHGATVPIDNATLLLDLDKLVNSVDRRKLAIVINQLDKAFAGSGPDLARLIESGDSLNRVMYDALPQTIRLVNQGKTALDTQRAVAGDLKSFADNLAKLSDTIHQDDPDFIRLIDNGISSARQLSAVIDENSGHLGVLLANLVTLSGIQSAPVRLDGLASVLTIYPSTVYNGFRAAPGDNKAHFGIVNDNTPTARNCETYEPAGHPNAPGYIGPGFPPRRDGSGLDKSTLGGPGKGNADCLAGSNETTVRGARNAPRPPGDTTGDPSTWPAWVPMTGASSGATGHRSTSTNVFRTTSASYDPYTSLVLAPDGQAFTLGTDGGQAAYYGADAWKWLLIAPTLG